MPNSVHPGAARCRELLLRCRLQRRRQLRPPRREHLRALHGGQATPSTNTIVFDAGEQRSLGRHRGDRGQAYDTATVTGVPGFTPSGNGHLLLLRQRHVHRRRRHDGHRVAEPPAWCRTPPPPRPLGAGGYSFDAVYGGDANYGPRPPAPASPSRWPRRPRPRPHRVRCRHQLGLGRHRGDRGRAYDTATVTGVPGFTPSGTVTYSFFDSASCSRGGAATTDQSR